MLYRVIIVVLGFCLSIAPATSQDRIPGSPYPASTLPDTLYTVQDNKFSKSELLTIETLQGILAQNRPKIFRLTNAGASKWLADLKANYGVAVIESYKDNFLGLTNRFKKDIQGYIVCNPGDNSVSVAISLCGISKAVAIAADKIAMFNSLSIPLIVDVRGKNEAWFIANYDSLINKNVLCYQRESRYDFLADYSVFGKMINFYEPLNSTTTITIFNQMKAHSPILGWGDSEYDLVYLTSPHNIYVHAADWANNLSTLTNFNAATKQKRHIENVKAGPGVHTVCFLMTDGDNIQWILNDFSTNSRWYGSPNRNKVNLGWTIAPALCELAPTVLKKLYDTADTSNSGADYFVAGPSGLGYIFPDRYQNLDGYAKLMNAFMKKADLRIVNILGNSKADQYLKKYLEQDNIDAIFFYYYSNYSGGAGEIKWVQGKPVISGRYNFWEGFETVSSLATKLNSASRDIHSPAGYSLIPVHVWSRSVADVIACVNQLNKDVRVVTPDELVALIKKNLTTGVRNHPDLKPERFELGQNYPNPFLSGAKSPANSGGNSTTTIIYHLERSSAVEIKIYNLLGGLVRTLVNANQTSGNYAIQWDGLDNSGRKAGSGVYIYQLSSRERRQTKKMILIQ